MLGPEFKGVNDVGLFLDLDDSPAPTLIFWARILVFSRGCSFGELSNHYYVQEGNRYEGIHSCKDGRFATPFCAYDQESEFPYGRFRLRRWMILALSLA